MSLRLAPIALALALLVPNLRLHTRAPRDGADAARVVEPQLAWLDGQLDAGAAEQMQAIFPEGFLFTHALVGLSAANLALQSPDDVALRARSLARAERALAAVRSSAGTAPFPPSLDPPHGAFHAGWSAQLAGAVVALGGQDPGYEAACAAIARAYEASPNPYLPSYSGQSWPVDSVVALSALARCDRLLGQDHGALLGAWVRRATLVEGLFPHTASAETGAPTSGPRASSTAVILCFLHDIDPALAEAQVRIFRRRFVTRRLSLPGVLEFPGGGGSGDVDSGPLIRGVSLSASAVALGVARLHGDWALADDLLSAGEALGAPVTLGGEKRYALGLIPVGDAFGAWALSLPGGSAGAVATPSTLGAWRVPWHLTSLLLVGLASLLGRRRAGGAWTRRGST